MGVKGLNCLVFLCEAVVAKSASNEGNHELAQCITVNITNVLCIYIVCCTFITLKNSHNYVLSCACDEKT